MLYSHFRPAHNILNMPSVNSDFASAEIVTDAYLQSVLETCTDTREQCMSLLDHLEANSGAQGSEIPLEAQLELSKQQKILYSHLAQLRGLNRNAIMKVRNTKQMTAEARQEIDRLHLQLQNLYYEERHLRGEIAACESYEYESQIGASLKEGILTMSQSQLSATATYSDRRISRDTT